MGTSIGSVDLDVRLNSRSLDRQATETVNRAGGIITDGFGKIGAKIGAVLAVTALAKFGADCIKLGSDLAEVQNVVDVTFGSMAGKVDEFAKTAITQFGLSQKVAKDYMGQIGSMAKAFNFNPESVYKMSTALTGLTGDVASFYNLSTDEAFTKLKAVFTGETEALKSLGVVMTQSALNEFALANGFGKTIDAMTEQEKVSLRLAFVQNALAGASGDFARTSDGWANSTRVLSLRFGELKATIGQGLINVFLPIVHVINMVLGKLQTLANYFVAITRLFSGGKNAGAGATQAIASNMNKASSGAGGLSSGLGKANKHAKGVSDNLKKAKGFLAGFDSLNVLGNQSDSSSKGGDGAGEGVDGGGVSAGDLNIPKGTADTSGVDEIYNKVKGVFDKITGFLTKHKVTITSLIGGIVAGFATFQVLKNWGSIVKTFKGISDSVSFLGLCFKDFFGALINGKGIMSAFSAVWGPTLGPIIAISAAVATVTAALIYLYQTSDSFRNLVNQAVTNLQGILSNLWNSVLVPLGAFLYDIFNTVLVPIGKFIAQVIVKAVETVASVGLALWNNVLAPVANFLVSTLAIALKEIVDLWNDWKPTIQMIGQKIQEIWDTVLAPVCDFFKDVLIWVIKQFGKIVKDVISNVTVIFGGLAKFITGVFALDADKAFRGIQQMLYSFLSFVDEIFGTNFKGSFKSIMVVVEGFWRGVSQAFSGIKQIFNGIIQFVQGVFSGNWKKAWQGIANIFGGAFGTISGLVKSPLNAVISIVNWAIDKINSIGIDVPGWVPFVGGKSFRPHIGKIPMLASGGYVQANTPQLAIIGDNRHEGEIVSPESKLYAQTRQAVEDVLKANQGQISGTEAIVMILSEILDTLRNMGIELDKDGLIKFIMKRNRELQLAKGG